MLETVASFFEEQHTLSEYIHGARQAGKLIVSTNGCFDLLHAGHVATLVYSRSLCDIHVVGVDTDDHVRALKGAKRPVISLIHRIKHPRSLRCVDAVYAMDDVMEFLLTVKLVYSSLVDGLSTSKIIAKVNSIHGN